MSLKRSLGSPNGSAKKFYPWFSALEDSLKDPSLILFKDDLIAVIADKYPKARFHFLAMPLLKLDNLEQLDSSHVTLLDHMIQRSRDFAKEHVETKTKNSVRFGFHMVPSMTRLHLHIVSGDLISPCLKHKKHWNSFASPFFMDADQVLTTLKEKGRIEIDRERGEEYLKNALRCHVCAASFANMPKLKDHLVAHDKDRSCSSAK